MDSDTKARMMELFEGGMRPEQWLKVWESGFTHEQFQVSDPSSVGQQDRHQHHQLREGDRHHHHGERYGNHHHHGEVHGHSTTSDTDEHGNALKVDSYLLRNIHSLTGGDTGERVFVTLCGNTKDLEWLCSKGYSVVGAELSEIAVRQAFENACAGPIPYNVSTKGEIKVYSATDSKNLKVYVGDFFKEGISPEKLGKFNCIWDSHGIISLPASQHQQYAEKLLTFLNPGGKILFSTVDYDFSKLKEGTAHCPRIPPIPCSKLAEYFPTCSLLQLEERSVDHQTCEGLEHVCNPVVLVVAP